MAVLTNTMMQGTAAISEASGSDYVIPKSIMLENADTTYLTKKPAAKGNTRTWTFSGWFKRLKFSGDGSQGPIFGMYTDGNNQITTNIDPAGNLEFDLIVGGTEDRLRGDTGGFFFDPNAWYHLVVNCDTTAGVEKDRLNAWVNGKAFPIANEYYPSQHLETLMSTNANHYIGIDHSSGSRKANLYISSPQFIDGLALSPAAFGEFNSNTGVWDPKAFALPAPNDGTTWSSNCTFTNTDRDEENLFDGLIANSAAGVIQDNSSNTAKVAFNTEVKGSIIEVWSDSSTNVIGFNTDTPDQEVSGAAWHTIYSGPETTLEKITWKHGSSQGRLDAIRVDGVILRDDNTDPATRTNPNNGQTWSDALTVSSGSITNAANAFNGNDTEYAEGGSNGTTLAWTPSSPITFTKLEALQNQAQGNTEIRWQSNADDSWSGWQIDIGRWQTLATDGVLKAIETRRTDGTKPQLWGVKIDDHILIDSTFDNSFRLDFNDDSHNRYIGKDTLNGKIADATGGKPIYVTSDDYGDVKGSGYAADSSAGTTDGTGLVLAMPGDTLTDLHASINTGSSNNSFTTVGTVATTTDQSRFYGTSLNFGTSDGNYLKTTSANSDFALGTGAFTIEAWYYINSDGGWDQGILQLSSSEGPGTYNQSGGISIYTGVGSGGTINLIVGNATYASFGSNPLYHNNFNKGWHHFAGTRDSSGVCRVFVDGMLGNVTNTSTHDITATYLTVGAYGSSSYSWHGMLNDIRIYKGVCKYNAPFKAPNRNDFVVNNLTNNRIATNTGEITAKSTATTTLDYGISLVSGSDESLTRDWGSGQTNNKKWTFATWFKTTNSEDYFLNTGAGTGGNHSIMRFESANVFQMYNYESSAVYGGFGIKWDISDLSLTDGNWHHYLVQVNTTTSNTKKRIKIWFDGVQRGEDEEAGGVIDGEFTPPGHNGSCGYWNNNHTHKLGDQTYENKTSNMKFAETYFVDGDNSSFGVDTFLQADGRPQPTGTPHSSISGSYGNKGFYLKYDDSGALGDDESGNTNDWSLDGSPDHLTSGLPSVSIDTLTLDSSDNFQHLTTGTTYNQSDSNAAGELKTIDADNKQLVIKTSSGTWSANTGKTVTIPAVTNGNTFSDTPTNGGTDTGIGGEITGNFCTLNPIVTVKSGYQITNFAKGNLQANASGSARVGFGTIALPSTGKWYWEVELVSGTGMYHYVGVTPIESMNGSAGKYDGYPGYRNGAVLYQAWNGKTTVYTDEDQTLGSNVTSAAGTIIGVAVDMDNDTVKFYKNGSLLGTVDTSSHANGAISTYTLVPHIGVADSAASVFNLNFGQRAFAHALNGHKTLCTQNLDDTFSGDELNNPSKYFDVLTYTGTGTDDGNTDTMTVGGLDFQPDLIWIKNRDSGDGWYHISDAIRGPSKAVYSNGNNAEVTNTNKETTPTSDGFTLEDGGGSKDHMYNDNKYVAWTFDAGSTASGANNNGSINISAGDQWVNATAGFSITRFTSTGSSGATVGHGLNVPPEFMLIKSLSATGDWGVYHKGIGLPATTDGGLVLNTTAATNTASDWWASTNPTNDVFSLGNKDTVNPSGSKTMICYAWTPIPGYSAFGTYVGNNSSDGPFCYTGFLPKFIIIKRTDDSGGWVFLDTVRDNTNPTNLALYVHEADDEKDWDFADLVSNGFKQKNNGSYHNASNATHVWAAFAENPFKTTRAR